ncbi:MAG TPA: RsmE family RNA methyltransferase [Terriglobales bacterium]|nr:RsmE family RNA methyltransferase [Terriglobales bacterium]
MTRRRWIADEFSGNRAVLTGAHAEHLSRVLRARIGQEFDIAAAGELRRGKISAITDARVEFELGEIIPADSAPDIALALSIFKFDRMEWAIEKCTELGAAKIIPVIASRTEPHLATAACKRRERWEKIAHQASEQSRRIVPPAISRPQKLKDIIEIPGSLRIVLSEVEQESMLKEVLESNPDKASIVIALGPEGGWTQTELDLFKQAGWISASLGNTILRAETAAIAALAVVLSYIKT